MTNAWRPQYAPDGANNFGDGSKNPESLPGDENLTPLPPGGPSGPGKAVGFRSVLVQRRQKRRERLLPIYDKVRYWRRRNA